jgi:two-component system, probable response regulator PhcQ
MDHAVLIVDDEPKIYHALRRALHREPYDVVYAANGEDALKILGERTIDVIVADQNMPNMQGSVLLARVRQQFPDVVRMMLTGDARLETVMAAVNKGEIYRFFTKPCNEAELIISLRDALQMRALKFEAARLLDTVKKQNAQLQALHAAAGTVKATAPAPASAPAPAATATPMTPAHPASTDELPPIDLKSIQKGMPLLPPLPTPLPSQSIPQALPAADEAAPPISLDAKKGRYVIDAKREIPQDVDKLLDEIRSELEKLDL